MAYLSLVSFCKSRTLPIFVWFFICLFVNLGPCHVLSYLLLAPYCESGPLPSFASSFIGLFLWIWVPAKFCLIFCWPLFCESGPPISPRHKIGTNFEYAVLILAGNTLLQQISQWWEVRCFFLVFPLKTDTASTTALDRLKTCCPIFRNSFPWCQRRSQKTTTTCWPDTGWYQPR